MWRVIRKVVACIFWADRVSLGSILRYGQVKVGVKICVTQGTCNNSHASENATKTSKNCLARLLLVLTFQRHHRWYGEMYIRGVNLRVTFSTTRSTYTENICLKTAAGLRFQYHRTSTNIEEPNSVMEHFLTLPDNNAFSEIQKLKVRVNYEQKMAVTSHFWVEKLKLTLRMHALLMLLESWDQYESRKVVFWCLGCVSDAENSLQVSLPTQIFTPTYNSMWIVWINFKPTGPYVHAVAFLMVRNTTMY